MNHKKTKIDFNNPNGYGYEVLETRRMLNGLRTNLDDIVVKPIIETILIEAMLRGMIPGLENENPYEIAGSLFKVACPAFGYVDPTKEVKADVDAINNKPTSLQRVVREHGADAFEVLEEQFIYRQKEIELENKYGFKLQANESTTKAVAVDDNKDDEENENDEDLNNNLGDSNNE